MSMTSSEDFSPLQNDDIEMQFNGSDTQSKSEKNNVSFTVQEDSLPRDHPEEKAKRRKILIRAVLGEFVCTTIFLFVVMASGVNYALNSTSEAEKATGPLAGVLVTAFCAVALIYSFADVSGAHFNPAVTFATLVTRKTSLFKSAWYWLAQILGSIVAAAILRAVFPVNDAANLAAVRRNEEASVFQALIMEFILSFILVYVIFATAFETVDTENVRVVSDATDTNTTGAKNLTIYTTNGSTKAGFAPLAIGLTLGFLSLVGGTVSGGAYNPARAFGPALIGNYWTDHWIYWIGDFFGAGLAGLLQQFFSHSIGSQKKSN